MDSFTSGWFDDPARQQRLVEAGPDALLATLAVLALAAGLAMRSASRGRGAVAACGVAALLLLGGLALYAGTLGGSLGDARAALLDFSSPPTAGGAVAAALAGLLPALLATGVAATVGARGQDRGLPREAFLALGIAMFGLGLVLFALTALAGGPGGDGLSGSGGLQVRGAPAVLVAAGGAEGGFLLGAFAFAVLLGAVALLSLLLEVPAAWLAERFPSWTLSHGILASGLVAYLAAAPLAFDAGWAVRLDQALAWVVAPLAGLLVSVHVGWTRPAVLDGYVVGDAKQPLRRLLVPVLRFAVPLLLLALLGAGALSFARAAGWADGSGGLWAFAP